MMLLLLLLKKPGNVFRDAHHKIMQLHFTFFSTQNSKEVQNLGWKFVQSISFISAHK